MSFAYFRQLLLLSWFLISLVVVSLFAFVLMGTEGRRWSYEVGAPQDSSWVAIFPGVGNAKRKVLDPTSLSLLVLKESFSEGCYVRTWLELEQAPGQLDKPAHALVMPDPGLYG